MKINLNQVKFFEYAEMMEDRDEDRNIFFAVVDEGKLLITIHEYSGNFRDTELVMFGVMAQENTIPDKAINLYDFKHDDVSDRYRVIDEAFFSTEDEAHEYVIKSIRAYNKYKA